jgi:soluble lytic murein transglycosylase-like protein
MRFLFAAPTLLTAAILLCGCASSTSDHTYPQNVAAYRQYVAPARLVRALNIALSWPAPPDVDALKGAVLVRDGGPVAYPELALARAILHTNPQIEAADALLLAGVTVQAARANGLPPEFLGATLLQESAYDPRVRSAAGAIGIAQFEPETAAGMGVDPYDPFASIAGAAALLGSYARAYRGQYDDTYAVALAAYNAGPGAVERYAGVPPYAETKEYVELVYERWGRIASYEAGGIGTQKGRHL